MNDLIQDKANKLAKQHIEIMELECRKVCERFQCSHEDLIIQYHGNTQIKINVKASHFEIINNFTFDDGIIKAEANIMGEINKEDYE